MIERHPTLPEAVEIAKFWRNRPGKAVIVQLCKFEGFVERDPLFSYFKAQCFHDGDEQRGGRA